MTDGSRPPGSGPRPPVGMRRGRRRALGLRARGALALYGAAGRIAAPFLPGYLKRRAKRGKEDGARRGERFGRASKARPAGPLAWVHAASVGETHAVMALAEHLAERGIGVVFTTGTATSAAIVAERMPDRVIHQYAPLDLGRAARRFLDHWRPDLAIVAESEVWPVMTMALSDRDIPHVVVNGRMSDRSFRRWRRAGALPAAVFARFALVAARSEEDARRFEDLGASPVAVTGDLKAEVVPPRVPREVKGRFRALTDEREVWVAASTHEGEELIAARVHAALKPRRPRVLTVIVPRHPERGGEVAEALRGMGLDVACRSRGEEPGPETDIFLGDTIGEMGLYLRLGRVVFVGRSLAEAATGGQNPIEPAMLARAVLHGPNIENFREAYAALDAGGGAREVADEDALRRAVTAYLVDPEEAIEAGGRASATVGGMRGPLTATLRALAPFIEPLAVRRSMLDVERARAAE